MRRRDKGKATYLALCGQFTNTSFASWASVTPANLSLFMTRTYRNYAFCCSLRKTHLNQICNSKFCYSRRWRCMLKDQLFQVKLPRKHLQQIILLCPNKTICFPTFIIVIDIDTHYSNCNSPHLVQLSMIHQFLDKDICKCRAQQRDR